MALVEPVAARYRTTLALNLGAMALAVLLGLLRRPRGRRSASGWRPRRARRRACATWSASSSTPSGSPPSGRLAAGIAHEINNPLEGMANYLSLARDALDARRRSRPRGGAWRACAQGLDRAALVVRQVLAHADPGRGAHGPARPQPGPGRDRPSSCARGRSSRACASRSRSPRRRSWWRAARSCSARWR